MRKKIDKILKDDPNASIVVMGDFNDYPDNKSITEVFDAACEQHFYQFNYGEPGML